MLKNIFALIGVFTVCKFGYDAYDKHLRKPVERIVTDALDDEAGRQPKQS